MALVGMKYEIGRGLLGSVYEGKNINTGETVIIRRERSNTTYTMLPNYYNLNRILLQGITCFDGFQNIKYITDKDVIYTVFGFIRQKIEKHIPQQICFIILHYFHRPMSTSPNIPDIFIWFGREGDENVLVMKELGPSLEDLFNSCQRKFSLKTVLMIADQMLSTIQYIQQRGFVHRCLKPSHFLIGKRKKEQNTIYLIDYSSAKRYRDPKTMQHIPYREGKLLIARPRYASMNNHLGIEPSRRDDLVTIGYILAYFYLGKLPWMGLKVRSRRMLCARISETKASLPIEELCKDLPDEFAVYLKYCTSLEFEDEPDYNYLRKLFRDLFFRKGYTADDKYDWCLNGGVNIRINATKQKFSDENHQNDQMFSIRNNIYSLCQ